VRGSDRPQEEEIGAGRISSRSASSLGGKTSL